MKHFHRPSWTGLMCYEVNYVEIIMLKFQHKILFKSNNFCNTLNNMNDQQKRPTQILCSCKTQSVDYFI